jgi:hypothetical protein
LGSFVAFCYSPHDELGFVRRVLVDGVLCGLSGKSETFYPVLPGLASFHEFCDCGVPRLGSFARFRMGWTLRLGSFRRFRVRRSPRLGSFRVFRVLCSMPHPTSLSVLTCAPRTTRDEPTSLIIETFEGFARRGSRKSNEVKLNADATSERVSRWTCSDQAALHHGGMLLDQVLLMG